MSMEINNGSIAGAMAVAALDRAEALDKATVALQAQVRKELGEAQAVLRQESTALQAAFRKEAVATLTVLQQEAEVLKALRLEVQQSVKELSALQPGIERNAEFGVQTALTGGMAKIRNDLGREIASSVEQLKDAARQVKVMVRRLTLLWASLIGAGGLVLGMLLMYFFMASWQRRIEEKIDRLPQVAPLQVQPQALAPPPAIGSGNVHQKTHGGHSDQKPRAQQLERAPTSTTVEQP